jgi:hypothetical protein
MKTLISLTGIIVFCLSAFARLGETNQQIYKRYGAVVTRTEISTNEWTGYYEFENYSISVTFSNNISMSELVTPHYPDSWVTRSFEDKERQTLFKKIGGNGEWKEVDLKDAESRTRMWTNQQCNATAVEIPNPHDTICISKNGYDERRVDRERKARASGF